MQSLKTDVNTNASGSWSALFFVMSPISVNRPATVTNGGEERCEGDGYTDNDAPLPLSL